MPRCSLWSSCRALPHPTQVYVTRGSRSGQNILHFITSKKESIDTTFPIFIHHHQAMLFKNPDEKKTESCKIKYLFLRTQNMSAIMSRGNNVCVCVSVLPSPCVRVLRFDRSRAFVCALLPHPQRGCSDNGSKYHKSTLTFVPPQFRARHEAAKENDRHLAPC